MNGNIGYYKGYSTNAPMPLRTPMKRETTWTENV